MATILALLGLVTLAAKTFLEWKVQQQLRTDELTDVSQVRALEPATAEV
jgi:hypothetical protein